MPTFILQVHARRLNFANSNGWCNLRQIEVIKDEIIDNNKDKYQDCSGVGIICPYRNQVTETKKCLKYHKIEIDTVHKFQGREKDTIIFSTVVNDINSFVDDANLINVAVSRGVKEFIVVTSNKLFKRHVHLEISHLKLIGKPQWGRAKELLAMIKAARDKGLEVTCDQYPYTATSTNMAAMVPGWAQSGGPEAMCERLTNPDKELLTEIKAEMERRGGADKVLIISTRGKYPEFDGKTLAKAAEVLNLEPEMAVTVLLRAAGGGIPCCYFCLSEDDMLNIMRETFICVGSDGYALPFDKGLISTNPHPRSFGTFPRFLQTIREQQLMSLEAAIAKITALPAEILGLKDRGVIAIGKKADFTIFDASNIADKSIYTDSLRKPTGINYVVIDGKIALAKGEQVGENFGRVLLHE